MEGAPAAIRLMNSSEVEESEAISSAPMRAPGDCGRLEMERVHVAPAMTVAQVLRERVLPDVDFHDPAAVIAGLNARFQMHRNNDLFFTIWYGVYDLIDRELIFASGGHHAAYLLPSDNKAWSPLPLMTENPIVGMLPDPEIAAPTASIAAVCQPSFHHTIGTATTELGGEL